MALGAILPALISGGFGLLGGHLKSKDNEAANVMNMHLATQNLANNAAHLQFQKEVHSDQLAENATARAANQAINERNIALQREFAQSGIQWRVQDAIQAGIHPLAALGGSGATYSPAAHIAGGTFSSPSGPSGVSANFSSSGGMGDALTSMGQDLSRAVEKSMNASDRTDSYTAAMQVLNLEKGSLENELLRSQLSRSRQASNPPMPVGQRYGVDGQGSTASGTTAASVVKLKEGEITGRDPARPSTEGHSVPDTGWARTVTGLAPVPSKDVKERIEDNLIQEVMWAIRNNIVPSLPGMGKYNQPNVPAKPGYEWVYNPLKQEYQEMKWRGWKHFGTYW